MSETNGKNGALRIALDGALVVAFVGQVILGAIYMGRLDQRVTDQGERISALEAHHQADAGILAQLVATSARIEQQVTDLAPRNSQSSPGYFDRGTGR